MRSQYTIISRYTITSYIWTMVTNSGPYTRAWARENVQCPRNGGWLADRTSGTRRLKYPADGPGDRIGIWRYTAAESVTRSGVARNFVWGGGISIHIQYLRLLFTLIIILIKFYRQRSQWGRAKAPYPSLATPLATCLPPRYSVVWSADTMQLINWYLYIYIDFYIGERNLFFVSGKMNNSFERFRQELGYSVSPSSLMHVKIYSIIIFTIF